MRKSKLGIQALRPDDKALEFVKQYRPGVFKVVIVNPGDFAGWMPQIPDDVFVIGRYLGEGVDGWEWTPSNARKLAAKHLEIHRVNYRRIDAWECINEPVAHTVEKMQQLAEFQCVWAEAVRKEGISAIVGNFPVGNPLVTSAGEINLMKHFRPAMEVGDYFAYHGYGCPKTLSESKWLALRYRELFLDAGMTMPVLLTECGVDCGSTGHGYKERWTDAEYMVQLEELDQALQADPLVKHATIFCYGHWNWPTFDLTRNVAAQLGEYIKAEGDTEEEEPPGPSDDWASYTMRGTVTVTLGGHNLELPVKGQVELREDG